MDVSLTIDDIDYKIIHWVDPPRVMVKYRVLYWGAGMVQRVQKRSVTVRGVSYYPT